MQFSSIAEAQNHARQWLFEYAAPLWSSTGVLADGMFAEKIGIDGQAKGEMDRRLRVQARQIYSFCTLGRMGWKGPWRETAGTALDILLSRGVQNGQCVNLFSPAGEVIDRSRDLYDHAFALFALAHAGAALDRQDALETAEAIRMRMADWRRVEGGYWEGDLTPCPPYRQNPHMHMYEASWSHHQISPNSAWGKMADEIRELFIGRLLDGATGAVTEYFDEDWRPLPGETGNIVEPGHCLEWAWLLYVTSDEAESHAVADGLAAFARKYGICAERDIAINEVYRDGSIRDAGARLWPQTERLKAAIARYQLTPGAIEEKEIIRAYGGLTHYFSTPVRGSWWDRMETDGSFVQEAAPASSFYHIVCALNELNKL